MSKPPKKPTYYIQRRSKGQLETVDEVEGYKEAKALRDEYNASADFAFFYISTRACRGWKERENV